MKKNFLISAATGEPKEWKIVALRECPTPEELKLCDTPVAAAEYWKTHISTHPYFNPEVESLFVLILNARRRIKGHYHVSTGTVDSLTAHAREIFRLAIMASAHSIILMHNHPSGESSPSEPDIKITKNLIQAGKVLGIELLDHVIVGNPKSSSLKELGFFYV